MRRTSGNAIRMVDQEHAHHKPLGDMQRGEGK